MILTIFPLRLALIHFLPYKSEKVQVPFKTMSIIAEKALGRGSL